MEFYKWSLHHGAPSDQKWSFTNGVFIMEHLVTNGVLQMECATWSSYGQRMGVLQMECASCST
eukprot:1159391-Pelagomonas_calceolata.AAC.2